jgi:hypothetical protein
MKLNILGYALEVTLTFAKPSERKLAERVNALALTEYSTNSIKIARIKACRTLNILPDPSNGNATRLSTAKNWVETHFQDSGNGEVEEDLK